MDLALQRKRMVEEQLMARGIKDERVLSAFFKVERHRFIPEASISAAYGDFPLPIGEGQTISQPYIVALMTEALGLKGSESVLEIGTGSGYQAAILAELSAEVFSIERIEALSERAKKILSGLGYQNVHLRVGDGTLGWPENAPFERIIITAASFDVPAPLLEQLKDGGRLILPMGDTFSQVLTICYKKDGHIEYKQLCGCVFVPLIGQFAYKKEH